MREGLWQPLLVGVLVWYTWRFLWFHWTYGVVRGSSVLSGIETGLPCIEGANCTRRAGRCWIDSTACLVGWGVRVDRLYIIAEVRL